MLPIKLNSVLSCSSEAVGDTLITCTIREAILATTAVHTGRGFSRCKRKASARIYTMFVLFNMSEVTAENCYAKATEF